MKTRYDTYCGLYCRACSVMLATEASRTHELARELNRDPSDLTCHGCKQQTIAIYCQRCAIRACAIGRGVEFCFECGEHPCDRLIRFDQDHHPHHSGVIKSLEEIHQHGLDMWLEQQRLRWSCTSCGQRFSWYDEICSACGAKVLSCVM